MIVVTNPSRPVNPGPVVPSTPTGRSVLGTLLHEWPAELPAPIRNLLRHAPESFDDRRLGIVATGIRETDMAGREVNVISVERQLNGRLESIGGTEFTRGLVLDSLPLSVATDDAEVLLAAYQTRRRRLTLLEAAEAIEANPGVSDSITRNAVKTLVDLDSDGASSRLTARTPSEILSMTFDDRDNILGDRLLAEGQSLVIAGAGGIGKSRLLLQLAGACVSGRPLVHLETHAREKRWLVIQAENSNRRLRDDLRAIERWLGRDFEAFNRRVVIHTLETDSDALLSIDDPDANRRIARLIHDHSPDLVAFDSLYNFQAGDLNADEGMRNTLLGIARLAKAGNPSRSTVVLHHAGTGRAGISRAIGYERSGFGRNSKVLHSWTRGQINVVAGSPDGNGHLVFTCGKCSNGREFAPFAARLSEGMIYEPDPGFDLKAWESEIGGKDREPLMSVQRVAELCAPAMTKPELVKAVMESCGCAKPTAYRWIDRAVRKTIKTGKDECYFRR